jgi:uroporphyrin-3 C-methyltransferase
MTEPSQEQPPAPAPEPPAPESPAPEPAAPASRWRAALGRARQRVDLRIAAVAVGLLLLAGLWLDTRGRINTLQKELVRELAEAGSISKESRQLAAQATQSVRDLEFKIGMLESRLSETQNQRLALEALYLELSRSRDERVLAEVEQILLAGSQQLQLAGNVKAALVALESADSRLQRSDGAQFATLRRTIARDIERLKSAPFVDVVGMSLRLDTLAHQADEFVLAMYERPAQPPPPTPRGEGGMLVQLAREAWHDVKGLIRIQRVDSREVPLVAPGQEFFLRENLRMRLLSARIALLARDETAFKADVRSARDWLQRYFDPGDRQVGAALSALMRLAETDVSIDLPDISASLGAVRQHKLARERGLR